MGLKQTTAAHVFSDALSDVADNRAAHATLASVICAPIQELINTGKLVFPLSYVLFKDPIKHLFSCVYHQVVANLVSNAVSDTGASIASFLAEFFARPLEADTDLDRRNANTDFFQYLDSLRSVLFVKHLLRVTDP